MSLNPRALGGTGGAGVAWAVTDMPQSVICSVLTIQLFRAQKAQPVCRANPPDDECVGEVFETRNLTAFNNPVFNPYRFSNRTDVMFCPPGYFCPVGLVCPIKCVPGQVCPAKSSQPTWCREGYYCPDLTGGGDQQIQCPKGNYCQKGVASPTSCGNALTTNCPAGSIVPGSSTAPIIMSVLVILVVLILKSYSEWKNRIRLENVEHSKEAKKKLILEGELDWTKSTQSIEVGLLKTGEKSAARVRRRSVQAPPRSKEELHSLWKKPLKLVKMKSNMMSGVKVIDLDLSPKEPVMSLAFDDLGLNLKGSGRPVLAGVSGLLAGGTVTAIMGPSGAGKTTLCNTLAGRAFYGNMQGTLKICGNPNSSINDFSNIVGFVPQDDIMLTDLTVKENLRFYADMRLPSSWTQERRYKLVDQIMSLLGIAYIQEEVVGDENKRGISGGQRKRVNVAMELVSDPTLVFLDEPTSGLDSTTSFELLDALKHYAQKGVNVVAVLHQPSFQVYQKFDNVLLLGVGGRTVFLGAASEAMAYFNGLGFTCPEGVNPADFFMDVIAGKYLRSGYPYFKPKELFDLWEQSPQFQQLQEEAEAVPVKSPELHSMAHPLYQVWLFFYRGLLQQRRSYFTAMMDAVLLIASGSLTGALFQQVSLADTPRMAFVVVMVVGMTTAVSSLRLFGLEKTVFWREGAPGVGMSSNRVSYFLGKLLADVPRLVCAPLFFLSTFYLLTAPLALFAVMYSVLFATLFAVSGIAYLFSIMMTPKNAQLSSLVFALVCSAFAGLGPTIPQMDNMGAFGTILYTISFARYTMEGLVVAQMDQYSIAYSNEVGYIQNNFAWHNTVAQDVRTLFLMGLLFRLASLLALLLVNRGQQNRLGLWESLVEIMPGMGLPDVSPGPRVEAMASTDAVAASTFEGKMEMVSILQGEEKEGGEFNKV